MDTEEVLIDETTSSDAECIQLATVLGALLFSLGALSRADLADYTGAPATGIDRALAYLASLSVIGFGVVLVESGDMVELRAAPEAAAIIENARKEAYNRDIGRAGMEVLAAVLYQGAQSRAQIDFIRGVNSAQILRTLAMRGLVRKIANPNDERQFLYEPTTELLAHLGVSHVSLVPEYESVRAQLGAILVEAQNKDGGATQ